MTAHRPRRPAPVRRRAPVPGLRLLLLLLALLLAGCRVELYTHLAEDDANDMLALLLEEGIDATKVRNKKDDTYDLLVEKDQLPVAMNLLKARGFPREKYPGIDSLFRKEGLISSPLEERVRFIYALSQNVQETLSRIDGVVTARVHIVLPENDPFSEHVRPSSASVFIKYLPESHLEDIKSEIKHIVERGIEGLSYVKVSLVMLPADASLRRRVDNIRWHNLWGVRVPQDSVARLRLLVWGLVATVLVLLALLFYLGWQVARWQQEGRVELGSPFAGWWRRAGGAAGGHGPGRE